MDKDAPDYQDYQGLAKSIMEEFNDWKNSSGAKENRNQLLRELNTFADFLDRRCFRQAEKWFELGGPFFLWLSRIFLCYRDKSAVVEYIRFQEQGYKEFDQDLDPLTIISDYIRDFFIPIGKKKINLVQLRIRCEGEDIYRFSLPLDPFIDIRQAYLLIIKKSRLKNKNFLGYVYYIKIAFLILKARTKISALALGIKYFGKWLLKKYQNDELYDSNLFRHNAAKILRIFSDENISLDRLNNKRYVSLYEYFEVRVSNLFEVTRQQNELPIGLTKFLKVFGGTLIGEYNSGNLSSKSYDQALKRAYCWAITYPLVDDILDSDETTISQRNEVIEVMLEVFADKEPPQLIKNAATSELRERMYELLSLIPKANRSSFKKSVLNVFEAHKRDAERRLDEAKNTDIFDERIETALLKSLLVRIATMNVYGATITKKDIENMALVAVFNQLGDDIWDALEDQEENRATPVTISIGNKTNHAVQLYLDYAAFLSGKSNYRFSKAIATAIAHTWYLANISSGKIIAPDLKLSLRKIGMGENSLLFFHGVPHVDPDSLLFDAEKHAI